MKINNTITTRAAWITVLLSTLLALIAIALYQINITQSSTPEADHLSLFNVVMALTFPPVGLLILSKRPSHAVGWIFPGIGMGQALSQFSLQYAFYTIQTRPGALPFGPAAYWLQDFIWFPSLCLFIILLAVFPTGQPLPGRWRWLVRLALAAVVIFLVARILEPLIDPQPMRFYPPPGNNFDVPDFIFDIAVDMALLTLLAAVVGLLLRLKRSEGVERQQLKWFTFAGLVFGLVFVVLSFLSAWPVIEPGITQSLTFRDALALAKIIFPVSVALIPASAAVAILRYRLYGIDVIIRRTLLYSILSVLVALVYTGALILAQAVFAQLAGQTRSELAIVTSTLAIAGLFSPARSRLQALIDRRFYRSRYNVDQALHAFSAELRKEVDLETLVERTEQVVAETIQPVDVSVLLIPISRKG